MDNPIQVSTGTQIQGTNFKLERSHPPIGRTIELFDVRFSRLFEIVSVIDEDDGFNIRLSPKKNLTAAEARLMASVLQHAATISSDFETWWSNS